MNINCIVDIASREVSFQENYKIAAYDHNVDVIHFSIEPIEDFSLNTSTIRIAAQGPNKARHDYAVDPSTVQIEEETGYITFDWPIPAGVTEMPIGTFKYGDKGNLIFAVCAEIISGDTVSKAWHSDDGIITVVAHLEPESGGGEDPEEGATNAQKIGQLQTDVAVIRTEVGALANGSPTPVATVAEMTDESAVYLYTGSETGYTAGNWYFWNGSAWTSGGTYGGAVTDPTLSISGAPADAKAVGEALAEKADADDVESLAENIADLYVPMPKDGSAVDYGEAGYVLMTNGDGTTEWVEMSGGEVVRYSVTNNLTNVTTSNGASSVRENRPYAATLTLAEGANLDTVTVTMNGIDITATAWNASTMTINIASVTGDVVITARASIVITQAITWTGSVDMSSQIIDATNANVYYEVAYNDGDSRFVSGVTSESAFSKVRDVALYSDAEGTNLVGYYRRDSGEIAANRRTAYNTPAFYYNTKVLIAPAGYYIQMMVTRSNPSFGVNDSFNSYVEEYGSVVVLETPEPEPEEETISNARATENDLLQMFRSVPLDTSAIADATTYEGVLEAAKNEWMLEYSGNINKIPLICHTDQHSSMTVDNSKAMWDTIDNMVSWYDISKVINLGDTTNSYENFDNPNLGDSSLDAYLEATENVPFSKRIEIFGNHDCMQIRGGSLTYIQQEPAYLNPYFKNVMARRTSNNGYHVTYDPYFNVKYIVISNYDYVDASHYQIASPAQYDFLIEEMSKNDGYDIVICSHVGLPWYNSAINNLITARYNKTSGTGTDSMGNSHSYDFTNCENDLLVCLHGHSHSDAYAYDMGVLSQCFKNYYDTTRPIYFVIVDRENNQLKVWKVTNTPEYTVYTRPFIETT